VSSLLVACACVGGEAGPDSGIVLRRPATTDAGITRHCTTTGTSAVGAVEVVVDRQARGAMLGLIGAARSCLDVFEFELLRSGSAEDVRASVIAAARRGVDVRVLLDDEVESNEAAAAALRELGIDARVDHHPTRTHLKMIAVDESAVLVGSTNLSGASIDYNHETNVLVRDPSAVEFFTRYLDGLWADPAHVPTKRVAERPNPIVPWLDGGYSTLALPAIATATAGIDLVVYGINLDPRFPEGPVARLAAALFDAVDRGVAVRVLLERSSWSETLNEINDHAAAVLRAEGVVVRFDDPDVVTHAKLLITDDRAMVGTNNWGYGGLVRDHEAGVMIDVPDAVSELSAYFEAQWSAAR